MTECIFSNLFFVKHQNLLPQNSCILPIKSLQNVFVNEVQIFVNEFRKGLARGGGREHSSDLMIQRVFSNLFFVKHQNLFPQNSSILPIKSIKTLQINCNIFCMFFEAWWAKPYQGISANRSLRSGGGAFAEALQYCCIRLTIKG